MFILKCTETRTIPYFCVIRCNIWCEWNLIYLWQDIEVTGDKDDSRCLHITIHRPSSIAAGNIRSPLLAAKFVFDDHIRCMAAKQRLSKGRQKARQRKLHQIARLLELPDHIQPCPSPLRHSLHSVKSSDYSSCKFFLFV